MTCRKLNLGCGNDIRKGWVNLDILNNKGVDVIHDLNKLPLPFNDNYFDYILCVDVLEHINYFPLMNELYRILKRKGILRIKVPHFTSRSNYTDPTHIRMFSSKTFRYFVNEGKFAYERKVSFFSRIHVRLELEQSKIPLLRTFLRLLYNKINKCNRQQYNYERTFLRTFPSESIKIILVK